MAIFHPYRNFTVGQFLVLPVGLFKLIISIVLIKFLNIFVSKALLNLKNRFF